jgi:hypothetical protein
LSKAKSEKVVAAMERGAFRRDSRLQGPPPCSSVRQCYESASTHVQTSTSESGSHGTNGLQVGKEAREIS